MAVGAAVQGHILAAGDARTGGADLAGTTDLLLLDVTPLSLGIELEGREMSVLIKRNTTIPCRKSRSYTTVEDWQTSIDVVVYEVRFLRYTTYFEKSGFQGVGSHEYCSVGSKSKSLLFFAGFP